MVLKFFLTCFLIIFCTICIDTLPLQAIFISIKGCCAFHKKYAQFELFLPFFSFKLHRGCIHRYGIWEHIMILHLNFEITYVQELELLFEYIAALHNSL